MDLPLIEFLQANLALLKTIEKSLTPDSSVYSVDTEAAGRDFPDLSVAALSLQESIKNIVKTLGRPLYSREIKDVLKLMGRNTTSVDTLCSRLRTNGEFVFFADEPNGIRGRYGLPGQNLKEENKIQTHMVLIQDLADQLEIVRFNEYRIYHRPSPPAAADYFAPYFTRNSGQTEGISKLSKINGALYFAPSEWENYKEQIKAFAPNPQSYQLWEAGLQLGRGNNTATEVPHTHYFLSPMGMDFSPALLKDPGRSEGAGVDWITLMIPANRVLPLDTLVSRAVL